MDRRTFVAGVTATSLGTATRTGAKLTSPNDKISIAAIGLRGRGNSVLRTFAAQPNVEIKYVVDVDESVRENRANEIRDSGKKRPVSVVDFRKALDDPGVDAIMLGTPTHWHAIPTILACQAGKDVYCEKPDAHNIIEGQLMVAAGKKYGRIIQLGTQSRSGPHFQSAMDYLAQGHLGKVLFAKAWESAKQGSLGKPADRDPPKGVDYDLWLGPAPKRRFNPLRFHGNWRWFLDYGAGDLGNDGVHRLDVAHWAFETALKAQGEQPLGPVKTVSAHGGKCYFDDLQEWPDNLMCTYDFGEGRVMTYEMRIWSPYPMLGESEGAALFGDNGYIVIGNNSWRAFGPRDKLLKQEKGSYNNTNLHVVDFLNCMQTRKKPSADLETIGHPSSLLCHLGNAAWRAGRSLRFDSKNYTFIDDLQAQQYMTREQYRSPWTLPKLSEI
ncbi:MAG: Gfo/Idh/MocA family oxidoreductase [Planctomycetota bacterium]|nr:Gfo/Idh/MocA family oxidoreductase [Planctomycetota bacterium]